MEKFIAWANWFHTLSNIVHIDRLLVSFGNEADTFFVCVLMQSWRCFEKYFLHLQWIIHFFTVFILILYNIFSKCFRSLMLESRKKSVMRSSSHSLELKTGTRQSNIQVRVTWILNVRIRVRRQSIHKLASTAKEKKIIWVCETKCVHSCYSCCGLVVRGSSLQQGGPNSVAARLLI